MLSPAVLIAVGGFFFYMVMDVARNKAVGSG